MTLNQLIAEAQDWINRNRVAQMPEYDPGEEVVRVESEGGTFESLIQEFTDANGPWLIVDEPDYEPVS